MKIEAQDKLEKTPRKKMSSGQKAKLIYTIELVAISLVFLTVATLEIFRVIPITERHHMIFNFVSLAGALWLVADFLWATISSRRRLRICYLLPQLKFQG